MHKSNKRTKSTKISSLFPKRGNRNTKRTEKHKNKMTHGKSPFLRTHFSGSCAKIIPSLMNIEIFINKTIYIFIYFLHTIPEKSLEYFGAFPSDIISCWTPFSSERRRQKTMCAKRRLNRPSHPRDLIRVYVVPCINFSSFDIKNAPREGSDQFVRVRNRNLRWPHISKGTFSLVTAVMIV